MISKVRHYIMDLFTQSILLDSNIVQETQVYC